MKAKFYLIIALVLALTVSGGIYAYTWPTATATINITEPTGDIATWEPAPVQPGWNSILPQPFVATEILRPNAAGDETNISYQYPTAGEHWDKVDDVTPDDWETYVYSAGSYKRDLYNLPAPSGSGTIYKITVYFRFSGDRYENRNYTGYAKAAVKTYGMVYEGGEYSRARQSFVTESQEWTTNPSTGQAWTWDEIDALQVGVSLKGQTESRFAYCTRVYVAVDYEGQPGTEGEVPRGDLFIITPHPQYTDDLLVKVYLTNTGALSKAYQYLNMQLKLESSVEESVGDGFRLLTLQNGEVAFSLQCGELASYELALQGGSYSLISADPSQWEAGWSITPEFYCEVSQR